MAQAKRLWIRLLAKFYLLYCLVGVTAISLAQEKPGTIEVEKTSFKVEITVDGVLESSQLHPIAVATQVWTDLTIEKIVDEGTEVKAGDVIAWFNKEKIDKAIQDAEYASSLSQLSIKETELTHQQMEMTLEMDSQLAERSLRIAEEDHKYYLEVTREQQQKSVAQNLKSARYRLENSQDELDQLSKMYTEDELTEESEAIVLKRAERGVEQAQFWLQSAEIEAQ